MNEQLYALVEHTIAQGVRARVFALRWEKQRIWVKQAVPPKGNNWHKLQRFAAAFVRIPMLRPTVSSGGRLGLAKEAEILRRLTHAGIVVPALLAETNQWIAISDNGEILQTVIEEAIKTDDHASIVALIEMAGKALASLHNASFAHGAPLLRNMTIRDDSEIGFIDFEEDPYEAMNLSDAQARDVLLFIFSIQRGFKRHPELLNAGWNAYLASVRPDDDQLVSLRKVARFLLPVYFLLKPFRRKLGTDARSALEAYRILRRGLLGENAKSS